VDEMSVDNDSGLCRLTVVAPTGRLEIALLADLALAELLPDLVRHAGPDLADAGLVHGGWVLQRTGDPPLDTGQTLAAQGIADGDLLHLRPRDGEVAVAVFDDMIDAVASTTGARADGWRPETTRHTFLAVVAGALLLGLGVLAVAGPPWNVPGMQAVGAALALLAAAGLVSRAVGDATGGLLLGCAVPLYAFLGGAFLAGSLAGAVSSGFPEQVTATQVAAGGFAALLAVAVAGLVIGRAAALFLAYGTAALLCAAGGLLAATVVPPAGAAAVVSALSLAATPLVPMAALRLARLRPPPVPADLSELRSGESEPASPQTPERANAADRYVTALLAAAAAVIVAAAPALAAGPGWAPPTLAVLLAAALLLRSRLFRGRAQRSVLIVPAVLTGVIALAAQTLRATPDHRTAVLPAVAVLAGVMLALAWTAPGRRATPVWGRVADIAEVAVVVAVVPVTLEVIGLYARIRGLGG
jgi:type VII secretion integral membrane protein EccD